MLSLALCGCDDMSIPAIETYWTYKREKEIITNEELHNLSSSLNITWVITLKRMTWWAWTCNTYERVENGLQYFIGKPEGIITFGRARYRWKNGFKTGVMVIMCEGVLD